MGRLSSLCKLLRMLLLLITQVNVSPLLIHVSAANKRSLFLLQNGGYGGATAVQWSRGLIAFIWRAANRSKPQRWPSHSWYVTETARFLAARCCTVFLERSICSDYMQITKTKNVRAGRGKFSICRWILMILSNPSMSMRGNRDENRENKKQRVKAKLLNDDI